LSDGTAVFAVISSDQQVFLGTEVPKDAASLQCLNNAQLTYFFSAFVIYSVSVPLNAAIGYFSSPDIALRVVLLPAPLAPSRATIEPSSTLRDTPCNTRITLR